MKALAIVANIFVPGVGSFILGQIGQGLAQMLIWGLGFMLTVFTLGFGAVIGLPMMVGAWIWGLITVFGLQPQTINVNVQNGGTDAR